ncbi:MAG TPA: hypothetical protein VFV16_06490 [Candidatus Nitrosotalea sp.]|nr:hypothetical protein [Candidatus Nitrosotalea sp.]
MKVENPLQAKIIAIKFLEQYNSSITFRSATLEGEVWIVILDVGMMNTQTRKVLVDRSTGNILSHTSKN